MFGLQQLGNAANQQPPYHIGGEDADQGERIRQGTLQFSVERRRYDTANQYGE